MFIPHLLYQLIFLLSANRNLCCFSTLAIVTNAAIALRCMKLFQVMFWGCFWIYAQELNCQVIWLFYFQLFENTSYCFPQWLHQLTFPSTVYKDFLSSIFSPTFVIHVLFIDSHSDRCEVILHCRFDLDFLDDQYVEYLCICLLAMCISSCLFSSSAHVLNWVACFSHIYVGCILTLVGHIICKYFLLYCRLSFHFVGGFLCYAKSFKVNQVQFIYFCFYLF